MDGGVSGWMGRGVKEKYNTVIAAARYIGSCKVCRYLGQFVGGSVTWLIQLDGRVSWLVSQSCMYVCSWLIKVM